MDMEKPNAKDFKYENGEFKDIVAYLEALELYNSHLEEKISNLQSRSNFGGYCSKEVTERKRCKNICDDPKCGW